MSDLPSQAPDGPVLVCGGAGYIGSHCVAALQARGVEVVVLDDLSTGHREAVTAPLVEADLKDRDAIGEALRNHEPRAVIHFAAKCYVGESVTDPAKYYLENVHATWNLLEEMRAAADGAAPGFEPGTATQGMGEAGTAFVGANTIRFSSLGTLTPAYFDLLDDETWAAIADAIIEGRQLSTGRAQQGAYVADGDGQEAEDVEVIKRYSSAEADEAAAAPAEEAAEAPAEEAPAEEVAEAPAEEAAEAPAEDAPAEEAPAEEAAEAPAEDAAADASDD